MKTKIFLSTFIIVMISLGTYFFLIEKNSNKQNEKSFEIEKNKKRAEEKGKNNELKKKKEKEKKEEIVKYLNILHSKIVNKFLNGKVINNAESYCSSKLFKGNNKVIVPKGANVTIFNFSRLIYNRPKINRYQVLYKGKIYCIYTRKVKKKAKIMVLRGGVLETSIAVRYILFPNGKFVDILNISPFYPKDGNPEYIAGIGTYTRTKNTIRLCNYDNLIQPYNNFPKDLKCLTLKRKGKIWNFIEMNQKIEFRLTEY